MKHSRAVLLALAAACLLINAVSSVVLGQTIGNESEGAPTTVVVVPFSNTSNIPADNWLSMGITESIVTTLSQHAHLRVVDPSRTQATLEDMGVSTDRDSEIVAGFAPLSLDLLITGGFQRVGNQLRVTARVIDLTTGEVTDSVRIDGLRDELFTLEDQLAVAIASRLAPSPTETTVQRELLELETPTPDEQNQTQSPPVGQAASTSAPSADRISGPPPPVAPETISRNTTGQATIRATRLTGTWQLDGTLDEAIYETVASFSDFVQQMPNEGAAASERTDVWVFYDDDNVYISARAWDTAEPREWVANAMRRDAFQIIDNDHFAIALDTFYDRRNGIAFMVNPIAGIFDYQITDEGNPNSDWNPIWDVRTGRFDGGWTVEMRIPFKSIRYQSGIDQIWGFQASRRVARRNEFSHVTPVAISAGPGLFRLSAAATLVGLEAPSEGRTLEIKPYAIASSATDMTVQPTILNQGAGDFGLDVKYGVTQSLTADFTYNTDFAQVEVDQQQVNLTRFSLFFPEKREFFLEGRGIFDFGSAAGALNGRPGGGGPRRVGGGGFGGGGDAPTIFFSRRIGLSSGQTVPILGGGRLTGKVGNFSIGTLNIQTDESGDAEALATNFTVIRVKRDIFRRSRIGVIFTGRSVSTVSSGSNEVYGLDAAFSFFDNVNFNGYYAQSRTSDLSDDNTSYQAAFNYTGDLYSFQLDHLLVDRDFNPEVGFMRRADFRRTFTSFDFKPRPQAIRAVRQFTFGGSLDYIENGIGQVETRTAQLRFNTEFENSDLFSVDVMGNHELLVVPFRIASDVTIPVGAYDFQDFQVAYSLGPQRRVAGNVSLQRGSFFNGDITAIGYSSGRIEITPQFSLEPSVSINRIALPQGAFTAKLISSRVTYTFTPRMFFGGLVQFNSGSDALSSNLRFRWEYQPGSELFVVYTDQRDTAMRSVPILENRAFIVKFNRLFRF
jgi:TolB-like protein